MRKQPKIPTLVGIFLLLLGVGIGVFLIQREKIFNLGAAPKVSAKEVRITNITDRGFSVSWVTDKSSNGFISYGKNNSVGTVVEQEQVFGQSSYVHQVTVQNLSPSTNYYFKIGFGSEGINKSKLYTIKTGPQVNNVPEPDVIFGTVTNTQSAAVKGAVVYLTAPGATPLSSTTDSSGKWTVNLSSARSTNLVSFASYTPETTLEIFVQAGNSQFTSAKIKVAAAKPVPALTLGKTHDFTNLKPTTGDSVPKSELNLAAGSPATPTSPPKSGFAAGTTPKPTPSGLGASATPKPTVAPTATPKPTITPSPTPAAVGGTSITDSLPSAGNLTATLFVFIMGMILVIVGVFVPQTA